MGKPARNRSRHLAPGDTLGKYELIRQIAIGGMAELYLARTSGIEGFEKLVVVKRILPQYVSNASFVNMFTSEARIAATLHHANIAQVYDIGVEDGDYFFAMEYIHGEDLDHMMVASEEQGVPISLDAALTLVAGLCAGLHYAHEKTGADGKPLQIVHRDVSPSNVLVSYDGSVKLVDFGIARASSRTTQGDSLKGKIAYMSPEQCKARSQLDRRSDIYAVGVMLYELSTGRPPFTGETEFQILNQIVNEDVPTPTSIVPSYPEALERIVMRALARDADARYATALELQSDVEDFAHEMRLRTSPLVLARLMSTLFPARLEEWDHAKSQGAFFVEQHVVRTLIESGKTPPPPTEHDTEVDEHHPDTVNEQSPPSRPLELAAALPGSLVTHGAEKQTERLRAAKRESSPTIMVRVSRTPWYALIALLAVGIAVAAFFVLRGNDDEIAPPPTAPPQPVVAPEPPPDAVVAPEPPPPPPPTELKQEPKKPPIKKKSQHHRAKPPAP